MGKKTRNTKTCVVAAAGLALAAGAAHANFVDGPEGIGDLVWEDTNMNGIQDVGESGLPGVTVNLLNGSDDSLLGSTSTDASGNYLFRFDIYSSFNPYIADFKIEFVLPVGYSFSPQDQGSDDTVDSDADTSSGLSGLISGFDSNPDIIRYDIDAGMYQSFVPIPAAVWLFGSGLLGLIGIARRKTTNQ
jgi:hypothetical protein